MVDLTTARAQTRHRRVTTMDTIPTPSADGVDRVYHQLGKILALAAAPQAESSLQCRARVFIPIPDRSRASW
jgi:hypothetical protein